MPHIDTPATHYDDNTIHVSLDTPSTAPSSTTALPSTFPPHRDEYKMKARRDQPSRRCDPQDLFRQQEYPGMSADLYDIQMLLSASSYDSMAGANGAVNLESQGGYSQIPRGYFSQQHQQPQQQPHQPQPQQQQQQQQLFQTDFTQSYHTANANSNYNGHAMSMDNSYVSSLPRSYTSQQRPCLSVAMARDISNTSTLTSATINAIGSSPNMALSPSIDTYDDFDYGPYATAGATGGADADDGYSLSPDTSYYGSGGTVFGSFPSAVDAGFDAGFDAAAANEYMNLLCPEVGLPGTTAHMAMSTPRGLSGAPRSMHHPPPSHDRPNMTEKDNDKDVFPCKVPDCKSTPGRRADLARHYRHVHPGFVPPQTDPAESPPEPIVPRFCDYRGCNRRNDPFSRLDHYRSHLRDYHREDVVKRNAPVSDEDMGSDSFRIYAEWWRCNKCVGRVQVATHGWRCPRDQTVCHDAGRRWRERRLAEMAEEEKKEGSGGGDGHVGKGRRRQRQRQ